MTITALELEYKDLYASEINRRDVLNQAVDRPIAIITAFGGIVYFCVSDLHPPLRSYALVQLLVAGVATFCILLALYYIIRSYWNHTYSYVPTARQLADYRNSLIAHYSLRGERTSSDVDKVVLAYIYESYVNGAHRNAENNKIRSAFLHKAKTVLIFALPIVIALGLMKATTVLSISQISHDIKAAFI